MSKLILPKILNELLNPLGFSKKGNYWTLKNDQLTKVVYLQKSKFSNIFYINYGFILNSLPLDDLTMHVQTGLSSSNIDLNNKIKELLNLENNISSESRTNNLKQVINEIFEQEFYGINTEKDLILELKNRSNLNDIPLIVKKYLRNE